MVDGFIQELKDLSIDYLDENSGRYIFFLGLTKLIDNFSHSSKAEMRKEFFKIKDKYSEEGKIFFELFPDYRNMEGFRREVCSQFEYNIYNLKTTENGLNARFEDFNMMILPRTQSLNKLFNLRYNSDFFKKLYVESSRINKSYLNVYNVSSYDLNSFSKKFYEASKISKDYDDLRKIMDDYFGGFDINIFILLSNFERNILDDIIFCNSFNVFEKLDNIKLDDSIFEDPNKFECFLSEFIIKLFGEQFDDNILFIISLFNMDLINEFKSKVFIPGNNNFSFLLYFLNTILSKKYFNYDLEVFTKGMSLSYMEWIICSLIKQIKFVDEIDEIFLNSIDLIVSNENIKIPSILNHFKNKNINPISLVSSLRYDECNFENFEEILNNDNLDCVFLLKDHDPMVILNSNKPDERKNKFLIYDGLENNHADKELDLIVDSYKLFKEGKYSKLFLNETIDNSSFKNHFNLSNLMYDKFRKSHNINYDKNTLKKSFDNEDIDVCLGDIADLKAINIDCELDNGILFVKDKLKLSNSLLMIPDFDLNWVYTNERIKSTNKDSKNNTEALVCDLNSDNVLKEYLFYYLNSDRGISSLNYFKRTKIRNYQEDLKYLRIPIPDIKTQEEIVDTARQMDVFFNDIEIFKNDFNKNILNYKPTLRSLSEFTCNIKFDDLGSISDMCSNWRVVYSGILWPLAITYLYATKKSNKNLNKKEQYLQLFEFFAAFNVIVLLSGIPHYKQDECMNKIWKKFRGLDNMTFGSWSFLYKELYKFYKKTEFDTDIDKTILMNISSKKYYKTFFRLTPKRNTYKGHNSMILDDNDKNLVSAVEDLEVYVNNDMLEIMKEFSGLKMYYTTGDNIKKDRNKGTVKQELLVLNGPCNPQFYYEITLNIEDELDSNYLYLYDPSKNSFLQINDSFMKLIKDEESDEWLLYLFDGFEKGKEHKDKSKYRCHQRFEKFKYFDDDNFLKELKTPYFE